MFEKIFSFCSKCEIRTRYLAYFEPMTHYFFDFVCVRFESFDVWDNRCLGDAKKKYSKEKTQKLVGNVSTYIQRLFCIFFGC